jgi:hypothetical protein
MLALALLTWAYWPGLSGPFLLDDYGNLDVLGAHGRIDNWRTFLYFLTSGNADPTGRPIALLTFLLDANTWPAAPWPFKRTNLILHLLNTALLSLTLSRLQEGLHRWRQDISVSSWTPLLAALLWGAHPFFVSTTLYVVQREAMLPMTFILLALLAWDRAVLQFGRGRAGAGWSWALLGFGTATLLAGLSKANGFLAPLLTGLAYLFFLRRPTDPPTKKHTPVERAAILCLAVPSVMLLGYLIHVAWQLWPLPILGGRDWTLPERLLSEPRALWTYMGRLVLPRAGGGGVYVDDFITSHSCVDPATTLPALLALGASLVAAIALRRRFPIASFAWLFFLGGHLLESSTIPLELYFEHRNYLPAAFFGWPLAHTLLRPGMYPRYRATSAGLLVATLLLLSHQRAEMWGDPALLGAISAAHESGSARAQVFAARQEIDRGDTRAGLARIRAVQRAQPNSVDVAVSAIGMECAATGALSMDTFARTRHTLATATTWNYGMYQWLQDAARDPGLQRCHGFGIPGVSVLITSAEANPQSASPRRRRDLWHVRGRVALAQGRGELALRWFDAALRSAPDADYALVQAAALGDSGAPALGVTHLDHFQAMQATQRSAPIRDMAGVHQWLLKHYDYYHDELSYLRAQLQVDARKTAPPHDH